MHYYDVYVCCSIRRRSLVVKHCLGKTETMGPIPIDGSSRKETKAIFIMRT